ncbi:Putative amino acid permease [Modestobacter italicus]|uniref:Amino acid permease n=1 Tax=Modestobacter italicus (strain DSM 44449 / CECT 9708 / BC 501) TaxID=2732864 RepID=I4ETS8_MODI5|nr:APC family permease [Modestobacter marinus]CCH86791.1 Putative amino acid permease [Modestobacter marinus]
MTGSSSAPAAPPRVEGAAVDKGLKSGALGLASSIVLGVSSTAPAYALAATLGFVVIAVGVKAPAIMLLAFVPMWLIAVAYSELNKREPDCGTTFTWAARAFGPRTGWMGGWGIIAADVIVMANLAQVAGSYGYRLVGLDSLAESTLWTTVAGVGWIALMTWICYRGIEPTARVQNVLLAVEVVVLVAFATYALVKVYAGTAPAGALTPSLSWLWPSGLSWASLTEAVLLAIFIYWGWDSAVAVNEETADPTRSPGRAAIISTVLLVGIYTVVSIATVAFAGVGTEGIGLGNEANAEDVFNALGTTVFGDDVFGRVFEALLIVSVLTSSAACTQTTILPTARGSLSMAAYGALPRSFARIHPRYLTPTVSTVWMGAVSIAFYVGLTLVSENVLVDSITATGMLIAFYYGLTGFACAWEFRRSLHGPRDVLMRFLLPLLGGLFMLAVFVLACVEYADPEYGETVFHGVGGVFVIGVGALLLGVLLMVVYARVAPAFFRGRTMLRGTDDLLDSVTGTDPRA